MKVKLNEHHSFTVQDVEKLQHLLTDRTDVTLDELCGIETAKFFPPITVQYDPANDCVIIDHPCSY